MSINLNIDNESDLLSTIGRKLYLNPERADVHFIFESGDERVPAHKIILSSGSDVFDTMFYGLLKEEGDIKIVDATAEAFKEFLSFFYFNAIDMTMENVSDVMYLGGKYGVPECLRLCGSLLESNITAETVLSALSLAIFHEQEQLQMSCELFIEYNLHEVLKSESFLVCDRRVLEHILQMDRLPCSETVLFEACLSWVRANSGVDRLTRNIVQSHLGNLFYEIRFAAMTSGEFSKLSSMYGELFSTNEYSDILRTISEQRRKPKLSKACHLVWDSARLIRWDLLQADAGRRMKAEEITKFSTNTWLLLGHFAIGPIFDQEMYRIEYIGNMNATVIANSRILTQFTFHFSMGKNVTLPKPIAIRPGTIYEIRIKFPTNEKRFCFLSLSVNMRNGIVVNFQNDDYVDGYVEGAIRSLGFNLLNSAEIVDVV